MKTFSGGVLGPIPRLVGATVVLGLCLPGFAQESPTTRSALAEIVGTRNRCEEYVNLARKELKGDRLTKARTLYIEAYSNNSAWVASVKAAIREGRTKHLDRDAVYERVSSTAASSSKEFADYVKTQLAANQEAQPLNGPMRGGAGTHGAVSASASLTAVLIVPLAELGIKLWKAHQEKVAAERQVAAEGFGKDAAWKVWDAVGAAGAAGGAGGGLPRPPF